NSLKASDNRNVPERKLTPHVVYHPSDNRWFALKIARTAEPLQQQEVAAQRDDVRKRIDDLIQRLHSERRGVLSTQLEAKREQQLAREAAFRIQELRKEHHANENLLNELARDVGMNPAMSALANRLQEVGDQELHNASSAIQKAEREKTAAKPRDQHLET